MGNRNHYFGSMARTGGGHVLCAAGSSAGVRQSRPQKPQETKPVMFYQAARRFIVGLIKMQQVIARHYRRADHAGVVNAMIEMDEYLHYYRYDSDDKMARFWRKNRHKICMLLPSNTHNAFAKLKADFDQLDAYAHSDIRETEVWQAVSQSFNKH